MVSIEEVLEVTMVINQMKGDPVTGRRRGWKGTNGHSPPMNASTTTQNVVATKEMLANTTTVTTNQTWVH